MIGPNALLALGVAGFLASITTAARHNMFVSSFHSRHLFAISFDDETGVTQEERAMMGNAGHTWMDFNRERTVLYASQRDGISSYNVLDTSVLAQTGNISLVGRCQAARSRHGETSLYVSKISPFNIYAAGPGRTPCGWVIKVRPDGSLSNIAQSVVFNRPGPPTETSNSSRVEGMVMSRDGRWLFSADSRGEGIWTQAVNGQGMLGPSRFTPMRLEDVRPRRLALHPSGRFLYVLCRRPNEVYTYEVIPSQAPDQYPNLVMLDVRISLVPTGKRRRLILDDKVNPYRTGAKKVPRVRYSTQRRRAGVVRQRSLPRAQGR
jgi:6-phosphogluconolactonase (cycloisomerase 2 family)